MRVLLVSRRTDLGQKRSCLPMGPLQTERKFIGYVHRRGRSGAGEIEYGRAELADDGWLDTSGMREETYARIWRLG